MYEMCSKENFKWVTNTYCVCTYRPHYDMFLYTWPHCSLPHPMNPPSLVAIRKSCTSVQSYFIAAWTHEVRHAIHHWFFDKATKGERTLRTIIPASLLLHSKSLSLPSPCWKSAMWLWSFICCVRTTIWTCHCMHDSIRLDRLVGTELVDSRPSN